MKARGSLPPMFIGIDPGASGGIGVLCGASAAAYPMPRTEKAIWEFFSRIIDVGAENTIAVIEQVSGFQGSPHPGSAMFHFGDNYGAVKMACVGHGLTISKEGVGPGILYPVTPQVWQANLRIDPRRKGESDQDWKNRLKWNAEQHLPRNRHPSLRITLRVSDALLIALYGRRERNGIL